MKSGQPGLAVLGGLLKVFGLLVLMAKTSTRSIGRLKWMYWQQVTTLEESNSLNFQVVSPRPVVESTRLIQVLLLMFVSQKMATT